MASASGRPRPRRFLPGDPRVEEPYRLTPQLALRVAVLGALALGVFAVLFLRLWALQVLSGTKYRAEANDNRVRTIQIDAPRGQIVDASGHTLVTNKLGTSLDVWPSDLPKSATAKAKELGVIAQAVGVPLKTVTTKVAQSQDDPLVPVVVRRGLTDDQVSYFKERRIEFPGVELADSYLRTYPYQSVAAHVLGYVGAITAPELKADKKLGYGPNDTVGQAGIEATYDRYLKGKDGTAQLTVDSLGRPTSSVTTSVLPQAGNTVKLTIELKLQQAAQKALKYGVNLARSSGQTAADGGAIVAMNPNTGAVLALASYPTYQPSVYVDRSPKKLAELQNPAAGAASNYPGIDRALDVGYPPGSIFKPVTALAALEEHLIAPSQSLLCSPTYTAYKQTFKNWDPDTNQWMELPQALAESCDTFFYQLGDRFYKLPSSRGHALQQWAARFGFGEDTGIDVGPEDPGLVPTPEWRRQAYSGSEYTEVDRTWKPGYSIQLAIGQGDLEVTPLQMARFYSLIANGGNLVTPYLVQDVQQAGGDPKNPQILRQFGAQPSTPSGVDASALQVVQEGLYSGTHSSDGTSYGVFGDFPVSIAGKTGSAQKIVHLAGYPNGVEETQSWWCGYGPTDSAQIVVCAVIENGGEGAAAAAPAALQVFKSYFKVHQATTITAHPSD